MKSQKRTSFKLLTSVIILTFLASVFTPINIALAQSEYPETKSAVLTPTPVSPSGMTADNTPTFKWTKVVGATQYRFQVFKGTSTTALYTKTITTPKCDSTTCTNTPAKLLTSISYKWKVQAYVNGNWQPYSALKNFTVILPLPTAPIGTIYDTTPTFKWTKVVSATQYRIQVFKGTSTTALYTKTITAPNCGTTYCTSTPTNVLTYVSYKWNVQAYINGGWKPYSILKSFSVVVAPGPIAPNGTIYDTTPTFKWTKVVGATQYRIIVMNYYEVDIKTITTPNCDATYCTNTPTKILPLSAYIWDIQAYVNGSWEWFGESDMRFIVATPSGFVYFKGWAKLGKYSWNITEGSMSIGGVPDLDMANAYYTLTQYSNFDYSARVGGSDEYCLVVRAGTQVASGNNDWYPGYFFCVYNGYFAIRKNDSSGNYVLLKDYTYYGGITQGFNVLRVVANGSNFTFYINGTSVSTVVDNMRTNGYVGIQTWGSCDVDWVVLGTN